MLLTCGLSDTSLNKILAYLNPVFCDELFPDSWTLARLVQISPKPNFGEAVTFTGARKLSEGLLAVEQN